MNQMVQNVCDFFDLKGMNYNVLKEDVLEIVFTGSNMPRIRMVLSFDEDGKTLSIHSYSIAKPKDNDVLSKAKSYAVCNTLNQKWRWFKFYLDSDDEFTASIDAIVDLYTAGEECHELILRMADILDKSYPLIMQSVWS